MPRPILVGGTRFTNIVIMEIVTAIITIISGINLPPRLKLFNLNIIYLPLVKKEI
jgi:hypothetical protein